MNKRFDAMDSGLGIILGHGIRTCSSPILAWLLSGISLWRRFQFDSFPDMASIMQRVCLASESLFFSILLHTREDQVSQTKGTLL